MQTLQIANQEETHELPGHWDEMSAEQVREIMKLAYFLNAGHLALSSFRVRAFYELSGIRRDWKSIMWEKLAAGRSVDEKNERIYQIAEKTTAFLVSKNVAGQWEVNFNSVVNFRPEVKVKGTVYHGPADLLSDLTFGEFRAATEEMNEYFSTKDPGALDRMIACLYRPQPKGHKPEAHGGRRREPFNRAGINRHAAKLKHLKPWDRFHVLMWFTWCIKFIKSEDVLIEGREVSFKALFPEKEKDQPKSLGLGWTALLFKIAKEAVFGNIQDTDQASLFDILLFMYDSHLENQKLKKLARK